MRGYVLNNLGGEEGLEMLVVFREEGLRLGVVVWE